MSNVLAFPAKESKQQHGSGEARCMSCGHNWIAVAPVGEVLFECPECLAVKGHYLYPFDFADGTMVRECNCGCRLFFLSTEGHLCAHCGSYQAY